MNASLTRTFVGLFAGLLLALGVVLTFLPDAVGATLFGPGTPTIALAVLGAALVGLGLLNGMTRHAPIGGIYGRPVLLANLAHFVVGGLALLREAAAGAAPWLWGITTFYLAGALFYGLLLVVGPARPRSTAG